MAWTLLFFDRKHNTASMINLNKPTGKVISSYEDELLHHYPHTFGIRMIETKNQKVEEIFKQHPEFKNYKFKPYDDFKNLD